MSLLLSLTAALLGTALIVVALGYRGRWLDAEANLRVCEGSRKADWRAFEAWKADAIRAGYVPPIKDPVHVLRDIFDGHIVKGKLHALPPNTFPLDLVIGTVAHPIQLDRSLFDSSLNDTAVASTLSDLVRSTGGRL